MQTNIFALIFLTPAAAPLMPHGSTIVFTSSVIMQALAYRLADYTASKAFLFTFSQALAVGLMQTRGIKVSAVRPVITCTPHLSSQGQTTMDMMNQCRIISLGRAGGYRATICGDGDERYCYQLLWFLLGMLC
jgi:short-subunit dehydrogenase